MNVKPLQVVTIEFSVQDVNGAIDADSTPTGTLVRNGADLGTTVTVTRISQGLYTAVVTMPADWSAGDFGALRLYCEIDGYPWYGFVNFTCDTKRTSDLQDLSQANIRTAVGLSSANLDTQLATIAAYIDTEIGSIITYVDCLPVTLNNLSSSDVIAACTSSLNTYDPPTNTEMEARTLTAANYATSAAVAALAAILSGITSLAAWLRLLARSDTGNATAKTELNSGGGTYGESDDSLQAIQAQVAELADIGSGGSYAVTVAVTSSGSPVQGATVKIKSGSTVVDTATTNASGIAAPTANAGTYTLIVSYPTRYVSSSQSLVVDGDESVAVSLTAISVSAPDGVGKSTGYVLCVDEHGDEITTPNTVKITCWMVDGPGTAGYSRSTQEINFYNDATGLAQYQKFQQGASYAARKGDSPEVVEFTVAEVSTFPLPEILGIP